MSAYENDVFHIGKDEQVSCYYCAKECNHTNYKQGEAFLASPGHSPCDGNANYICTKHLDVDAVIYEPTFPIKTATAATK